MKTIPPTVFAFLNELRENNNRPWFNENKPRYKEINSQFKAFGDELLQQMSHIDHIEGIKLFRIYRDVRFSKNKSPYKTSFSGGMKRATKWLRGGYYFHVEPGDKSVVAGGFWGPESADLKRIREDIAADDQPLRKIINDPTFVKTFGELYGEGVKTAPKGYSKDHRAIDLLRLKQYLVKRNFTDQEVLAPDFMSKMIQTFQNMRPFFDYMSEVLTTDSNGAPLWPKEE